MRKKIAAANWKMFKTNSEAQAYFNDWAAIAGGAVCESAAAHAADDSSGPDVVFFPSAVLLKTVSECIQSKKIKAHFGAQNIHFEKEGAFTGETSLITIQELGANYALIGHSERRTLFNESDSFLAKKVKSTIDRGLTAMLCVGETLKERQGQQTFSVLKKQLTEGLVEVIELLRASNEFVSSSGESKSKLIIAYEPVWAIGTGQVATPEQAEDAHFYIRSELTQIVSEKFAAQVSILYGGSVKPDNAQSLAAQPNIDGFLVGGASLKPKDFFQIVQAL